jgi:hypothetical protein
METIRINGKDVNTAQIKSLKRLFRHHEEDVVEPGYSIQKVIGKTSITEAGVEVEFQNGSCETVWGPEALAILKVSKPLR